MKPTIGRIVFFRDGQTESPAIITKVWSEVCVNLTIFGDCAPVSSRSSVVYSDILEASCAWRWPPRDGDMSGFKEPREDK